MFRLRTQANTILIVAPTALLLWLSAGVLAQGPLSSAITYQGQLKFDGQPVNGRESLRFDLYDAAIAGHLIASTSVAGVDIIDGLFTVPLDFGAGAFNGDARWLEVLIDDHGWIALSPRQPMLAAPYALYAVDGAGGGGSLWSQVGNDIFYDAGRVGVGTSAPDHPFTVERHLDNNINPTTVLRTTGSNATSSLRFENGVGDHFNLGITGNSELALGYNANVPLSGDLLRIMPSGNVGIGTTTPQQKLSVKGVVESTSGGFKFPDGTTQITAATGGGGGYWSGGAGGIIYYNAGNIGVRTSTPEYPLHVHADADAAIAAENPEEHTRGELGSTYAGAFGESTSGIGVFGQATDQTACGNVGVQGEAAATNGRGVYGRAAATSGSTFGVYGEATSNAGCGVYGEVTGTGGYGVHGKSVGGAAVYGEATSATGGVRGVEGFSRSPNGYAILGYNEGESGNAIGVKGETSSAAGFGGYFVGRGYFSGDVGIGTAAPSAKLDVAGMLRAESFWLDDAPTDGHVLTCNASGVGTWQAPSYFELPYSGVVSCSTNAVNIINSGSGPAIYATSDNNTGIHGYGSGAGKAGVYGNCPDGYGIEGYTHSGEAAVYGHSINGRGGWFESNTSAVYAYTSAQAGVAVNARAEGAESVAVQAISEYNALTARGGWNAAKFVGDVRVYGYSSSKLVFHVDDDTGITSVDVLHIAGGADLAENFAVSGQTEPGMVVEIDPERPGQLRIASGAYNRRVAGVISGANDLGVGMVLGNLPGVENAQPIALSGRVWVHCDATSGAIVPGDLLTTAERPGHAMAVRDFECAQGAVLGKAMTALAEGETGMVLVLINLQ